MDNANSVLKDAFIDAQLVCQDFEPHKFSPEFEIVMKKFIKSQKSIARFFNTAGKRAASIIVIVMIVLVSTVVGVDALRVPLFEGIERIYVEVKEKLTGTRADNIAEYFTDDITEIHATNCITSTPKKYIINDEKKISEFVKLMKTTDWTLSESKRDKSSDYIKYKFEFKNKDETVTTVNMWTDIVEIVKNGKSVYFNISERTYLDILAFTTRKYYLHKSDLEQPTEKQCLMWQSEALADLDEEEQQQLGKTFRYIHNHIEDFLLDRVSLLKEPDSVYWDAVLCDRGEVFIDPFTGENYTNDQYYIILDHFDAALELVKNKKTKGKIEIMKDDFIKSIQSRDIGSVFSVHEVVHDYDHYVINYPAFYELEPPDWGGDGKYFGTLD